MTSYGDDEEDLIIQLEDKLEELRGKKDELEEKCKEAQSFCDELDQKLGTSDQDKEKFEKIKKDFEWEKSYFDEWVFSFKSLKEKLDYKRRRAVLEEKRRSYNYIIGSMMNFIPSSDPFKDNSIWLGNQLEKVVSSVAEIEEDFQKVVEDFERQKSKQGGDATTEEVETAVDEVEEEIDILDEKLKRRKFHKEVIKYCKSELEQEDYFHAVLEASKGLSQRIRDISGKEGDGTELIDKVFPEEKPLLRINKLKSKSDKSEQRGFILLLKGYMAFVRNLYAHEPKILLEVSEDDAADYLSLLSLLHRKLDKAERNE